MLQVYLASPYSRLNHEEAYKRALFVTKNLIRKEVVVFSPIVYGHQMREVGDDWWFWKEFNKTWLDWADVLAVYCLDGWSQSVGVTAEIKYAENINKKVLYYDTAKEILEGLTTWPDN